MNYKGKTLAVITGPTASGKSALAVEIAQRLGTEIISADSRQVYKGIPIVTAMPTAEERAAVRHHLIDMLPLEAYYSASSFESDALRVADTLWQHSDWAVVCGGSMMYVDALCHGLDELPTVPAELRERLMNEHAERGDAWLLQRLAELDPVYRSEVDERNIKRVFHGVELSLAAGRPYSELRTGQRTQRPFRIVKICLDGPREVLFSRINERVVRMMADGLEEEARSVEHLRYLNSLNTVGLKEMFAYFDGVMTREEAVARIQKTTRVYAKKQLTWYRRDTSAIWLDITMPDLVGRALREITGRAE